MTQLYKQRIKR